MATLRIAARNEKHKAQGGRLYEHAEGECRPKDGYAKFRLRAVGPVALQSFQSLN